MGPFQQLVESQAEQQQQLIAVSPNQPGPFEQQIEARENVVVRRTGKDRYLIHGWDAAGRPIQQQTNTPEDAATVARAAEVGKG